MIKIRLALFLGYYFGNLFITSEKKEFYRKYIDFLFYSLESTKQEIPQALSLQAIECLQNIFDDESLRKKNQMLLQDLLSCIIIMIPKIKFIQFFDLLQDILKYLNTYIYIKWTFI